MYRLSRLFFLLLAFATCFAGRAIAVYAQKPANVFTGQVVAVTAGDAVNVRVSGSWTVTVRLHGIASPTKPRTLRETATRYTSRLVLGTEVCVEVRGTASRSVVYGEVFGQASRGRSVNVTLVQEGLATWAEQYAPTRADLRVAENKAKLTRRGLWGASDGANVTLPAPASVVVAPPAVAPPAPASGGAFSGRRAVFTVAPSPKAPPTKRVPAGAGGATTTDAGTATLATTMNAPLLGAVGAFVAMFAFLLAYATMHRLPLTPKRIAAQVFLALFAGGCGAAVFALPVDYLHMLSRGEPRSAAAIGAFVLPLISAGLLYTGTQTCADAARRRGNPVDPRRAEPGFVKLHGVAKPAHGQLACSDVGNVSGLYVREITARYTAETGVGAKRLPRPRWVAVRDTTCAVDVQLFSSAGDGTGSAVLLCEQDDNTPRRPSLRWIPYHVARFYNDVATNTWYEAAYEGDTRTEIYFVPNGATLTVWGDLHPPAFPGGVAHVAPGAATGTLLLCDGAETRAYSPARATLGVGMMLLGTFCAATAFYAAIAGGQVARLCTVSALGLALLLMLLLALRRGIALSRAANTEVATDTPHHPAGMVWETFRRGFPGAIIAPAIGD